jgi:ribosomal protein S18 acetylase RimI-like enzyme
MIITNEYADIEVEGDGTMRTLVCAPKAEGVYPGVLFYSDIFQLTGPMVRAAARLAGYGFVVAAPEIYHRIEPPGTVIAFDDEGRTRGLEDAERTPVADFDASCRAALDYLAARAIRTAYVRGLIRDHGLHSPLNRGDFYACVGARGEVRGAALFGHATLIEAEDDEAGEALARFALTRPLPKIVRGERAVVGQFWHHYQSGHDLPHRLNRELLMSRRRAAEDFDPVPGLRRATRADLSPLVEVNAGLIQEECGANPLARDPAGFRRRLLERIERGRVWVWGEAGRIVFKTDVLADTPEAVYIEGVYVAPRERGRGLGALCLAQLSRLLLGRARAVCLTVDESKHAAVALYRKAGYELDCEYATVYLSAVGEAAAA